MEATTGETKDPTVKERIEKLDREARHLLIDVERGDERVRHHMGRAVNALGRALGEAEGEK